MKTPNVMLMIVSMGRALCVVRNTGGVGGCEVGTGI
jgi:hypothetical protein